MHLVMQRKMVTEKMAKKYKGNQISKQSRIVFKTKKATCQFSIDRYAFKKTLKTKYVHISLDV